MEQENTVLCYEGIQRIYRNAVVRFLRSSLTEAFPYIAIDKLKEPFQKEWEKIKNDALETRKSGELESKVIDEFDLLSVNHFFNVFSMYTTDFC